VWRVAEDEPQSLIPFGSATKLAAFPLAKMPHKKKNAFKRNASRAAEEHAP